MHHELPHTLVGDVEAAIDINAAEPRASRGSGQRGVSHELAERHVQEAEARTAACDLKET